MYNT